MEFLHQFVTMLAGLLGMDADTFVALIFGAASGKVTFWVTNWLDALFVKWGIFTEILTGKIKGTVMTIVNALVAVAVIYVVGLVFGVNYLSEESIYIGVIGALGVNQNVAQWIFHRLKAKNATP